MVLCRGCPATSLRAGLNVNENSRREKKLVRGEEHVEGDREERNMSRGTEEREEEERNMSRGTEEREGDERGNTLQEKREGRRQGVCL
jgi:hypothetical protein